MEKDLGLIVWLKFLFKCEIYLQILWFNFKNEAYGYSLSMNV
jgi:hypothetical protein